MIIALAGPGSPKVHPSKKSGLSSRLPSSSMRWFFAFFFVSGLCSLLYEIVWLRLAMAQFGVTTALVSIVVSMFMAGLGLGSWAGGKLIRKYRAHLLLPALRLYALTELLIGVSALLVPQELILGRMLLERTGWSSSALNYLGSGLWIALTLVPWCACMGATIPLAMEAIRDVLDQRFLSESQRAFSFLYLGNVLGAVAGTILPLVVIELWGFHATLRLGEILNLSLAASAMLLSFHLSAARRESQAGDSAGLTAHAIPHGHLLVLLFLTGFTSMGMELVWIRQFTPYLGTVVYAFASILRMYLASTFIGSQIYRRWSRHRSHEAAWIWSLLGFFALLPLFCAGPSMHTSSTLLRLALGIAPFSGLLGFLTPMLVDRCSRGDPDRAGSAYAANIIGCIIGPLLSGFLLLPVMSERWVLLVFSLPWFVFGLLGVPAAEPGSAPHTWWKFWPSYAALVLGMGLVLTGKDYEDQFSHRVVLRDHTATIIATGEGMQKKLLVNGYGITGLAPSTKIMAHLPLAFLDHPPQRILVICFGMGTTYRSAMSWGIRTTAVELVPSVPRLFGYYHNDADELLQSPLSQIVIDDGRRFLERTVDQYDVITLDPPPPVQAAGSSLLYSKEFYAVVRPHLRSGGTLQQWLPYGDPVIRASFARALQESFPHVRVFHSVGGGGFHFLASEQPLPTRSAVELLQRMPPRAVEDLMEWGPAADAAQQLNRVLRSELTLAQMIAGARDTPALQDDHPQNEYYKIRGWQEKRRRRAHMMALRQPRIRMLSLSKFLNN
jgi:spermidine synthase